jgi:hypothetical protein
VPLQRRLPLSGQLTYQCRLSSNVSRRLLLLSQALRSQARLQWGRHHRTWLGQRPHRFCARLFIKDNPKRHRSAPDDIADLRPASPTSFDVESASSAKSTMPNTYLSVLILALGTLKSAACNVPAPGFPSRGRHLVINSEQHSGEPQNV